MDVAHNASQVVRPGDVIEVVVVFTNVGHVGAEEVSEGFIDAFSYLCKRVRLSVRPSVPCYRRIWPLLWVIKMGKNTD